MNGAGPPRSTGCVTFSLASVYRSFKDIDELCMSLEGPTNLTQSAQTGGGLATESLAANKENRPTQYYNE